MITLIDQLVNDLREEFANQPEYSNVVIKDIYELYPILSYPGITIEEIENDDNNKYFDETERVTDLSYQFTIQCEQSRTKTAKQNVREIAGIIDNYLKGPKYRCLRRIGSPVTVPKQSDDNVMVGYLRYDCCIERDTNTIYRRY